MIGFTAEYASGQIKPDGIEIEDARWFSAEYLPVLPGKISISRKLIEHFLKDVCPNHLCFGLVRSGQISGDSIDNF